MRAAIAAGYGIEVDVQLSGDGEAMVYHDDALGRLTEGEGRLDRLSAAELKRVPFRDSNERMMTLADLCDLVAGRATILIEFKSRFDGDVRLANRVAEVLAPYARPGSADVVRPLADQGAAAQGPQPSVRDHCSQSTARIHIGI